MVFLRTAGSVGSFGVGLSLSPPYALAMGLLRPVRTDSWTASAIANERIPSSPVAAGWPSPRAAALNNTCLPAAAATSVGSRCRSLVVLM